MKKTYIQPQITSRDVEYPILLASISTSTDPMDGGQACTMGISLDESSEEVW